MKHTIFSHVRNFFTKKRIIWTVVILVVLGLGYLIFGGGGSKSTIQTVKVSNQDIKKTVLTTGQVVSSTDLSLSFQTSGFVRRINVKEGDTVRAGQTLAVLDQGNAGAQLESAQGQLKQAQANYDKIRFAATTQDIAVSAAAVASAQTLLDNAKQNLLNELSTAYNNVNTAVLNYTNVLFSNPQSNFPQFGIQGTIQTNAQLVNTINNDRVSLNLLLPKWQAEVASVNSSNLDTVIQSSLSNITFVSNYLNNIITVLTTYTQLTGGGSQTTLSSYQSGVSTAKSTIDGSGTTIISDTQAVKTAESSLLSAKASLSLKQAPARPEDIAIAEAQVLGAQGQVHSAETALNNTVISAPTDGTVTVVDIKLGELATAGKEVIKLLNVGELHTEALVSEADIAALTVGQDIDMTFDALGPDQHFTGKILTVNPASTVVSGVVNYKVTGNLENIPGIKPGMTANMTILIAEKKNILVAPNSAIINKDGKKFIRIIDDPKAKTYHEREVTTALEADGGLTEITSGLSVGEEVVTYLK